MNPTQNTGRNYAEVSAGGSDNPRWEPNKNDANPSYPKQLEGYFKRTIELPGKNSAFTVAEIQMMNADGTLGQCVDVSGGKVLEDKLREIPLGSWIMIQYLGKVQGKQNTYNDWKTFVDDGAVPLHQLMGLPAPVQHFQQQAPVAQQQAPVFGQPAANPFQQAPVAQQQAAPVFNTQAPTAQPVFNTPPATNQSAPAFQQQVPAFNQAPAQGFPVQQQSAPVQNNGQMPGMQGQPNPFAQNTGEGTGLPF